MDAAPSRRAVVAGEEIAFGGSLAAGARAVGAQANTWEALAVLSAAILAVYIAGIDLDSITTPVMAFVALRIAYIPAYIGNKDIPRSLIFLVGYGICMYLFYLALSAT